MKLLQISGVTLARLFTVCVLLIASSLDAVAQPEVAPVDSQYVWDLSRLYPSPEAWTQARDDIQRRIPLLASYEDRLGESADVLQEALDSYFDVLKEFYRLAVYANRRSDEDTRIAENRDRTQIVDLLSADLSEATSYFGPELVALGEATVEGFIASNPGLAPYDFYLRNMLREAPHVLGREAESVLASASLVTGSASSIYNIISNADMPWPTITLPGGEEVTLSQSEYSRWRGNPDREVRRLVFDAFWDTWGDFENTYGSIIAQDVQSAIFKSRARKYGSALEASLSGENVPLSVYRTLIEQTNDNLETLHRYFRLRGRMLGIDQMKYYDIYPSLVEADLSFTMEDSKRITLLALEPLGDQYLDVLRRGFEARWVHVYPQPGKRSGAYMSGAAYDVHPYILLNYLGNYDALSTFAHEWGHAVHSVLSNETQPFSKADYSTFTAEVASIINEVLLQDFLIEASTTDEERLFYLGQVLEGIRGTFFRQAMFAEFELAIHEEMEAGNPLSGTRATQIYLDLLKKYHGHDLGVIDIDERYAVEWAFILHFFNYDFYVYQYATSIAGGVYFAERLTDGGDAELEAFLNVLRAGGSDYAYDILKEAGVDLATPEPYQALVRRMNDVMDEIEEILDAGS